MRHGSQIQFLRRKNAAPSCGGKYKGILKERLYEYRLGIYF